MRYITIRIRGFCKTFLVVTTHLLRVCGLYKVFFGNDTVIERKLNLTMSAFGILLHLSKPSAESARRLERETEYIYYIT